jgi:hypothetical protein
MQISMRRMNSGVWTSKVWTRLNKLSTTPKPTMALKMAQTINIEYVTTAMLKINWQTRMRQRFIESEISELNSEAKHYSCSYWWHNQKSIIKITRSSSQQLSSIGYYHGNKLKLGLEVITAVVMKTTVTSCSPIKDSRRFGETYRLRFQGWRISQVRNQRKSRCKAGLFFDPKDGVDTFFRNIGWLTMDYMILYPTSQFSLNWDKNYHVYVPRTQFNIKFRSIPRRRAQL